MEPEMRAQVAKRSLENLIQFKGPLDFERELIPFIRENVDLFVCCHRQGDPSCTYLETMSCGVPIAGYDNEAFAGLVKTSAAGWFTPMDRPKNTRLAIPRIRPPAHLRQNLPRPRGAPLAPAQNRTRSVSKGAIPLRKARINPSLTPRIPLRFSCPANYAPFLEAPPKKPQNNHHQHAAAKKGNPP
jgi:hypothetical protein